MIRDFQQTTMASIGLLARASTVCCGNLANCVAVPPRLSPCSQAWAISAWPTTEPEPYLRSCSCAITDKHTAHYHCCCCWLRPCPPLNINALHVKLVNIDIVDYSIVVQLLVGHLHLLVIWCRPLNSLNDIVCKGSQQSGSQAGKVKRGTGASPYHPYSR